MRISKSSAVAAAIALNVGATLAATTSFCPTSGVCYQWGIPESSAKAGSGDIYFQLSAPTSQQWIGLGIGSQMLGASIFVIYQDGNGNVTLSTRLGQNHVMPTYQARSDVQLLAGSGVVGGNMIANVKCGGCSSNLDLSGSSNWIAAWKSGSPLDSTNPSATITQHDDESQFQVNLASASISSDSNPFLDSDSNSGGSSSSGGSGSGSNGGSGTSGGSNGGDSGGGTVVVTGSDSASTNTIINAHGILMSIIFVCMYPIGSIIMPLFGKWQLHAAWQFTAFLGMWAGFGLGYTASRRLDVFFVQAHTGIGIFVVALLTLQPIFGWLHHANYVKTQSRGVYSYLHIWYGRVLMIMGIINGGLGLQLAGASNGLIIAYSVVAGVLILLYLGAIFIGLSRSGGAKGRNVKSPVMMTQES